MKETLFQRCRKVIESNYYPKDRHFTSKEEIDYINKLMKLDELNSFDLQNLRDMWVLLNSDGEKTREEELRYYSVIAIIDDKIYE